eukprot:14411120-Heterocapsa_arctica.AAC.1
MRRTVGTPAAKARLWRAGATARGKDLPTPSLTPRRESTAGTTARTRRVLISSHSRRRRINGPSMPLRSP